MNKGRLPQFIAGQFQDSLASVTIPVINPATEQVISWIPDATDEEVDRAVSSATHAQQQWAYVPGIKRAAYLRAIAEKIRARAGDLAAIITEEQGKIPKLARDEVEFTAAYLDYMAEWARRYEGEIIPSDRHNENIFLFKLPLGVVAGILPWNFPFFLIARKMAPALITGNTIVLKSSEETPNNAYEFAKLVAEVGLPAGTFNLIYGRGPTVGHALASHPKVDMVTFTGSVTTGSNIMAAAAQNITRVSLELGGKAPAIVMGDALIDQAVDHIRNSRVINSGQVCNCAERVYVQRDVADEFIHKVATAMQSTSYGNPNVDPTVEMGPLINQQAIEKVDRLVSSAIEQGAEVITGGKRVDLTPGHYYEPTVLTCVSQNMEIMRKEIFGPVLPVVVFDDFEEAIAMANDSEYGLTSSIYTQDLNTAMRACHMLKFGETYVNRENFEAMQGYHSGWRKSGIGGADGKHGVEEFLQPHMVYIQYGTP